MAVTVRFFQSGVAIRYTYVRFYGLRHTCAQWDSCSMPLPLQRVALLRRRVQANCPAASYWLRRDGSVEISPSCKDAGAQPVMHIALLSNCVAFLTDTSGWTSQRNDREALLPQTNRATRNVSRNLVQQIKLTESITVDGCVNVCASSHDASTVASVVNKLDRR